MKRLLNRILISALVCAASACAATVWLSVHWWGPDGAALFRVYTEARALAWLGWKPAEAARPEFSNLNSYQFLSAVAASDWRKLLESRFWWSFRFAPLTGAGLGLCFAVFLAGRPRGSREPQVQRGAVVVTPRELRRLAKRAGPGDLELGGVPIPREVECLHFLVSGTTGSGKTVAITQMLNAIRARGDRAVVADPSGLFLSRYWRAGDQLINPRDARCAAWSPLAEMDDEGDAATLAKSYCPDLPGDGRQWSSYAQTVLTEILRMIWRAGGDNASLHRLACVADREELAEALAGTPAAVLVAPDNGTMGANVRAMVASAMAPVAELPGHVGRDGFSVRWFVREGSGWLYLPYLHEHFDAQRHVIAALIDTAARALLSLPPDPNRRIWIICDELPSLGVVSSLEIVATNARKYGGALICGLQALAQLRDRYGPNRATSILSCLNTWLVLRPRDHETAKAMADTLGHREVLRRTRGEQQQAGALGRGSSWAEHIATEHSVLPSELQALPALSGYLSLPGLPAAKITLRLPPERPAAAEAFVPRAPSASAPQPAARASAPAGRPQPDPDAPPVEISL